MTIVPPIIPLTVGLGTIGALLVMDVGQGWEAKLIPLVAIFLACLTFGTTLHFSNRIERLLGDQGLQIVSYLMGLFVYALAAQIIVTGLKGSLFPG